MALKTVQRITKSGSKALCINVPKKIQEILEIKAGDYIEIGWGETVKKEGYRPLRSKKKKGELPKL